MYKIIHDTKVYGAVIDDFTRCAHYHGRLDIIAIKFKCCERYYPCFECHLADADHAARVRARTEFDEPAVLCGNCGRELTAAEYLQSESQCPDCEAKFNPGCANHYHLYFEQ